MSGTAWAKFISPRLSAADPNIQPHYHGQVPRCSEDCASHDGKRCRLLGLRPDAICEPAVIELSIVAQVQR